MKKRLITCLLAGPMIFSLAACNQSGTSSAAPSTAPSQGSASSAAADDQSESSSTGDLSGIVKTGGSTSVEKVMNALIYKFQEDNEMCIRDRNRIIINTSGVMAIFQPLEM